MNVHSSRAPRRPSRRVAHLARIIAALALVPAVMLGLASTASAETNRGADCNRLLLVAEWHRNMADAYWWDPIKAMQHHGSSADAMDFYIVNC